MRKRTVGERATFVAAVIGIAVGLLFLFAPIHGICSSSMYVPPASPGAPEPTFGPATCGVEALWQRQPIFPMPFVAIAIWSLAPGLAYLGTRMRARRGEGVGTLLMAIALFLSFTSVISFGAAPFFIPFVAIPTLVATAIALSRPPMG